jgi:hypothetical protein
MRTGAAAALVVAAGALASAIATTAFGAIGRAGQPPLISFVAAQDHLTCPSPTAGPAPSAVPSYGPSAVPCPTSTPDRPTPPPVDSEAG